jgi:microcystin-dependent protein
MALSYVLYTGNGSETDFNVTFDYLDRSHVHVYLDDVESSDWSWVSDTLIRLDDPADADVVVKIGRSTPNASRLVDFANGSVLDAESALDTDSNQLFYIIQELTDELVSVIASENGIAAIKTDHFDDGSEFTAGVSTTLTLSADPGSKQNTFVFFDGVAQDKSSYSVSGTTLTLNSPIPGGVGSIEVVQLPTILATTILNDSVTTAKLADGAVTEDKLSNNSVSEDKLQNDSVSTDKIQDGAVTEDKLDPGLILTLPIGTILDYAGLTAPSANWMICDGAAISRSTYATLFGLTSTRFGTGNGTTTFNIPDFRGRTAIGSGTGTGLTARTNGGTVGTETHTLSTSELPAHSHSLVGHSTSGGSSGYGEAAPTSGPGATGSAGSGAAHNNMQPSLVTTKIIRVS